MQRSKNIDEKFKLLFDTETDHKMKITWYKLRIQHDLNHHYNKRIKELESLESNKRIKELESKARMLEMQMKGIKAWIGLQKKLETTEQMKWYHRSH